MRKNGEPRSVSSFANRRAEDSWNSCDEGDSAAWAISLPILLPLLRDTLTRPPRCKRPLNRSLQIRHAEGLLNEDGLRT